MADIPLLRRVAEFGQWRLDTLHISFRRASEQDWHERLSGSNSVSLIREDLYNTTLPQAAYLYPRFSARTDLSGEQSGGSNARHFRVRGTSGRQSAIAERSPVVGFE